MDILQKITEYKRKEIESLPEISEKLPFAERNFLSSLSGFGHVIAEIKPASPGKGRILSEDFNLADLARKFEKSGATAISVLTDEHFFQGSFENLQKAKQATKSVPILCKDFIISEKQIRFARSCGADTFLLIVKILSVSELKFLLATGRKYKMEPLAEIADEEDLQKILQTDAKIIGINNRDLRDFSIDLSRTFRLSKMIPKDKIIISLSGFFGSDVRLVKAVANGVLVGSGIQESGNKKQKGDSSNTNVDYMAVANILSEFIHPKPLIKFCGVRTKQAFEMAKKMRIPLLGLNFVSSSKRCIPNKIAEYICGKNEKGNFRRENMRLVGVFQNQSREFVQDICSKYNLDFAQLSGQEKADDFVDFLKPIIKGVSLENENDYQFSIQQWNSVADLFLFDGKNPGSGHSWREEFFADFQKLTIQKPFLVAGGVNDQNAKRFLEQTGADGIDTASGIEDQAGEWNEVKMRELVNQVIKG